MTCGSFCIGRFMHPGWAWGRLGEGPCGWAEKTRLLAPEGDDSQTSPSPQTPDPAPIPESAPFAAPTRPHALHRPGPPRPHWSERNLLLCGLGRGAAELRKSPPHRSAPPSPTGPPPAPCPCVPGAQEARGMRVGAQHAAHACGCRHPGGRGEEGERDSGCGGQAP